MKLYLALAFLLFNISGVVAPSAVAQSYKVKKDVLYKDKVAIANLNGSVGLTKSDLTLTNLQGEPILFVSGHSFKNVLPGMDPIFWYSFTFPKTDQKFLIKPRANYFGTRQFIKNEFAGKDIHFYQAGFKTEELQQLDDYTPQLASDTLKVLERARFFAEALTSGTINRPLDKPVEFKRYTTIKGLVITQGYRKNADDEDVPIIIGRISYYFNEGNSISDPSRAHRITVFKKVPGKIDLDGTMTNFIPAAYVDLLENIPNLYLYQTNRNLSSTDFRIENKNIEDAKKIAKYLVRKKLM